MELQGTFSLMILDKTHNSKYSSSHTDLILPANLGKRVCYSIFTSDSLKNYANMVYMGTLSSLCSCHSPSYYYLRPYSGTFVLSSNNCLNVMVANHICFIDKVNLLLIFLGLKSLFGLLSLKNMISQCYEEHAIFHLPNFFGRRYIV